MEDNIKMVANDIGYEGVDWVQLTRNWFQWAMELATLSLIFMFLMFFMHFFIKIHVKEMGIPLYILL